jgi:uncharacterized damage-inducible protein DinB
MADQQPPRRNGSELATVQLLLQFQRDSVVRKLDGLDDATVRRQLVPSATTLLWLIKHLTRAEHVWLVHRFAGEDELLDDTVLPHDTIEAVVADYRAKWARVDAIVAAAPSLDATSAVTVGDESVSLRWILMHLLEETARHAGHADILRELIDGETGR